MALKGVDTQLPSINIPPPPVFPPPSDDRNHHHRSPPGAIRGNRARAKRQLKAFKVKERRAQLVLGLELTVDKVAGMQKRTLIGRLEYIKLTGPEMKTWMQQNWEPIIGYTPRFSVLMKGWFCFHFISEAAVEQILKKFWTIQRGSLVLEHWYMAFDPVSAPVRKRHLWVILPGFPLHWWKQEILILVANALGTFVQVDQSTFRSFDKRCASVMVEFDVTEGLPAELEIT